MPSKLYLPVSDPPPCSLARPRSTHDSEAAVSFVLDWTPEDTKVGSERSPRLAIATQVSSKTFDTDGNELPTVSRRNTSAGKAAAAEGVNPDGSSAFFCDTPRATKGGVDENGGQSGSRRCDEREASSSRVVSEQAERESGREALMRLGIFLEKHEVQEDTVDVLSSAGWL